MFSTFYNKKKNGLSNCFNSEISTAIFVFFVVDTDVFIVICQSIIFIYSWCNNRNTKIFN